MTPDTARAVKLVQTLADTADALNTLWINHPEDDTHNLLAAGYPDAWENFAEIAPKIEAWAQTVGFVYRLAATTAEREQNRVRSLLADLADCELTDLGGFDKIRERAATILDAIEAERIDTARAERRAK